MGFDSNFKWNAYALHDLNPQLCFLLNKRPDPSWLLAFFGHWLLNIVFFFLGMILDVGGWNFWIKWCELCYHGKGWNTQIASLQSAMNLSTAPLGYYYRISLTALLTWQARTDWSLTNSYATAAWKLTINTVGISCPLCLFLDPSLYKWNKEEHWQQKSNKTKSQTKNAKHDRYKILKCLCFRSLLYKYIKKWEKLFW